MVAAWAFAFAFTLLVEVPLALVLLRGRPPARVAAAAVLASALTHPALWWLAPPLFASYWSWIVVGELTVALVEGLVFWRLAPTARPSEALAVSFRVNGGSYLLGLLLQIAGLWPSV